MKLSAGLGLAALIITAISFFIPFVGFFVTWLALLIAAVSAYMGDKGLTIATIVLATVKFLISPTFWVSGVLTVVPSAILVLLPIAMMVLAGRKTSPAE